jgi:hypothetical protein
MEPPFAITQNTSFFVGGQYYSMHAAEARRYQARGGLALLARVFFSCAQIAAFRQVHINGAQGLVWNEQKKSYSFK